MAAAKIAVDLATIGMHVGIAFETVSGERPTDKYYDIQKPKSTPDLNPAPETMDTTSLNATKYRTSMPGLIDLTEAQGITFGMSDVLMDMWDKICDKYDEGIATGLRPWLELWHPNLTKAWFIPIAPARMGVPAAEVGAVWDATVYFTVTDEIVRETAVKPVLEEIDSE